jgi:HPt (histidine-containing phosphotransfer) domain-containing protein
MTSPVFDPAVYAVLSSELGAADAAEVLSGFLADTKGKLDRLGANPLDRDVTRREAHSIKSSAATFGFEEMSSIARELEAVANDIEHAGLSRKVGDLNSSFARVRDLSRKILSTQSQGA